MIPLIFLPNSAKLPAPGDNSVERVKIAAKKQFLSDFYVSCNFVLLISFLELFFMFDDFL